MGQHHILSVSEDAIMLNKEHESDLEVAIGKAVISLCYGPPQVNASGPKPTIVQYRDVLNCGGAIRHAGDVHYTDTRLFAWVGSRLKEVDQLSRDELEEIGKLVAQELRQRGDG